MREARAVGRKMGAKPREAKGGVDLRGGKMRRRVPGGRVMGGGEMALWAREVGGARGGGVPGAGPRGRGGGAAEAGAAGRRDWKAERGPAPAGGWKSLLPARRGQRLEEAGVGDTRQEPGAKRGGRTNSSERLSGPETLPPIPEPQDLPRRPSPASI